MSEGRGLLTEREREALRGEDSDNYRYKTRTYVKRRLEKLEEDITVLENHEEDLLQELRAVVCDSGEPAPPEPGDTRPPENEIQGGIETSLDRPPEDVEVAIAAVNTPGSGETREKRERALRAAYDYLEEHGEARRGDFKELLGDDVGYADFYSWWQNYIHEKEALAQLPNVDPPGEAEDIWQYNNGGQDD